MLLFARASGVISRPRQARAPVTERTARLATAAGANVPSARPDSGALERARHPPFARIFTGSSSHLTRHRSSGRRKFSWPPETARMEFIFQPAKSNRIGEFLLQNLAKEWDTFRAA